uniref:Uncharacterized protein n=1 Tax=Arundo donax TaxID=35708 RepID=A0A0A9BGG8_ARUDO
MVQLSRESITEFDKS